jgi:hypothetical protein
MKHTEHQYITLGYKYERAQSSDAGKAIAEAIRNLLESESINDRSDARNLVEQGRKEARATA